MAPRLVPENPIFPEDRGAEKKVWKALARQLPDECILIHGLRITRAGKDREGDMIVIWPKRGIVFIEVKGGSIKPLADGTFLQKSADGFEKIIDPVDQVSKMHYQVRDWLKEHTLLPQNIRMQVMVAFPNKALPNDYESTEMTRNQFIAHNDMNVASDQVRRALDENTSFAMGLAESDAEIVLKAFEAKTYNAKDLTQLKESIDERSKLIQDRMKQNYKLLSFVRDVPRFEVVGPAGSGKTLMAVELAHQLRKQGKSVLFLCYSTLLAAKLKHDDEQRPRGERLSAIRTFHNHADSIGLIYARAGDGYFFEEESPKLIIENLPTRKDVDRFDAVIMDEGQYFSPLWIEAAQLFLTNPAEGNFYIFSDDSQGKYTSEHRSDLKLPRFLLDANLRNSNEIAQAADLIAVKPAPSLGYSGPPVMFVEVPEDYETLEAGSNVVSYLIDESTHIEPSDIALVSTKHRHQKQRDLMAKSPQAYARSFWDGEDIFYSTVGSFRGLDRAVVVLCIDGINDDDDITEILYIGMTRARDVLIVVSRLSELEGHVPDDLIKIFRENELDLELDKTLTAEEIAKLF